MRMALTSPSAELPPDLVEVELSDDYESLTMDACQLLAETDARFVVSGFGQEEWPVNISYDLSSVIEQLPEAIENLQSGRSAEIDLYGQGIERRLTFVPAGDTTEIRCVSGTAWRPEPDTEVLSRTAALELLTGLAGDFGAALRRAAPELATRTPFAQW
ncbi:hypothetical protein [Streptomyces sp. XY332]|uniref:hypothetical protein n=1 Tax=Streptomyces sp. XY332 TaxID=1415561 RepID=UPI0006B1FFB7|nr:hypothetical protein [Streptomyces sp. XY332]KOY50133.1 hypothetical protein ADK59_38595 [Streptomyces sp. XY332]